jgi:transcriptional regulator with XRE-family HTH domain
LSTPEITKPRGEWAELVRKIRSRNRWSQETLAERLQTDQATVSRWERGLGRPIYAMQQKLEALAEQAGFQSLAGIATVVRESPFPMLLTDREGVVLAASVASALQPGLTVVEQTPPDERAFLEDFRSTLEACGFWSGSGPACVEYAFRRGEQEARAIVVAVSLRGQIYAVVQRR